MTERKFTVVQNGTARTPERIYVQPGYGSGNGDGMDSVDAKIAASEARTDTKFAELRGDLKDFATKGTVWTATGVIIATFIAVVAFGGDRFDAGLGMADVRQAQIARDADQDKAVQRIEDKIDQLIAGQSGGQ